VFQNQTMSSAHAFACSSVGATIMIPPHAASSPGVTSCPWRFASSRYFDQSSLQKSRSDARTIGLPRYRAQNMAVRRLAVNPP
jgi:hypothetical protein